MVPFDHEQYDLLVNPSRNACMPSVPSRVGPLVVKMSDDAYIIPSPDYSPDFVEMPRIFVPGDTELAPRSSRVTRYGGTLLASSHLKVAVPSPPQSPASSAVPAVSTTQREGVASLIGEKPRGIFWSTILGVVGATQTVPRSTERGWMGAVLGWVLGCSWSKFAWMRGRSMYFAFVHVI